MTPPTDKHLLWSFIHCHGHGADSSLFWAIKQPTDDELIAAFGIDFEPDKGESLDMSVCNADDIKTFDMPTDAQRLCCEAGGHLRIEMSMDGIIRRKDQHGSHVETRRPGDANYMEWRQLLDTAGRGNPTTM